MDLHGVIHHMGGRSLYFIFLFEFIYLLFNYYYHRNIYALWHSIPILVPVKSKVNMTVEIWVANGLRHVSPYYQKNQVFVKGRWVGRTVLDVLVREFRSFDDNYYTKAIQNGNFKLIRKTSDPVNQTSTLIKPGDILESRIHKHEPPIKDWNHHHQGVLHGLQIDGIPILFENDQLLVVDKPCGIPVHPTGGYYYNSLTAVIKNGHPNGSHLTLYPCHRLDKVTSGITIMAKTSAIASQIQRGIQSHQWQKVYLARVKGQFPGSLVVGKSPQIDLSQWVENNSTSRMVKCISPIYCIQTKKQYPSGLGPSRPAETWVYPGYYDPITDQSVVICKPLTGRTHQIRIHLLRLGYPIVNDTLYCPKVTKYPKYMEFIKKYSQWEDLLSISSSSPNTNEQTLRDMFDELIQEATSVREERLSKLVGGIDTQLTCIECSLPIMRDPQDIEDLTLCLHAWKYYQLDPKEGQQVTNNNFQTELPPWACS